MAHPNRWHLSHLHLYGQQKIDSKPTSNATDAPTDYNTRQDETDTIIITDATDSSYVNSLLAATFSTMGDYP